MAKVILVTGATGKQGGAVITALANNPSFTLLAVTRNTSSSSAQTLASKGKNIKLVQGDLNDVPALFTAAREAAGQPLWGVYSVQVSIGKEALNGGEVGQGNALVDESVKAGVKHFVYSSVERGGDDASWDNKTPIPHFQTKYEIEHYLRERAGGMGWTVLRPVAFMDNLGPTFQSQVFAAVLRDTMGPKPLQWIAVRDIGIFAKLAFEDPAKFNHKALGLAGDELTFAQLSEIFKKKTTGGLDGTFWIFGLLLKTLVSEIGTMINWFASDGYKANISELRRLHPGLLNVESWIEKESSFPKK